VLDLGAALESDESPQFELADGTGGRYFGQMGRAKYPAFANATVVGRRMAPEIAKIPCGVCAEQIEIDDNARLLRSRNRASGRFLFLRQRTLRSACVRQV
jgi:hypothetical protein